MRSAQSLALQDDRKSQQFGVRTGMQCCFSFVCVVGLGQSRCCIGARMISSEKLENHTVRFDENVKTRFKKPVKICEIVKGVGQKLRRIKIESTVQCQSQRELLACPLRNDDQSGMMKRFGLLAEFFFVLLGKLGDGQRDDGLLSKLAN